jgi:pilus assembly protein Flp/PilA
LPQEENNLEIIALLDIMTMVSKAINFDFTEKKTDLWEDVDIVTSNFHTSNFLGKEENPMFKKMQKKGQGLVEYALILVLVAIVIIIILSVLGPAIGNVFSQIVNSI